MKKTIVIVEDDQRLRRHLLQVLSGLSDIECVGDYASAEAGLEDIPRKMPDVILMDLKLPKMSGIQCIAELRKALPVVHIIVVTIYEDSESIFNALKAGANGYLIKSGPTEELIEAIRDIGGAPMTSFIARKVVGFFHTMEPSVEESKNLSRREHQVLTLLASGYLYKEIGGKLNIGVETVRGYVKSACKKMHVRTRLEAVVKHSNKH